MQYYYYKNHYENHKQEIMEKHKEYYEKNLEMIREKRREIIKCECGMEFTRSCKSKHERRQKHQEWLSKSKENVFLVSF